MKKQGFVVIRRDGNYIIVVPNVDSVIAAWINENVTGLSPDMPFKKQKKLLAFRGFSFHPISGSDLANIKPYSKTM